jgi:DNA polymerase
MAAYALNDGPIKVYVPDTFGTFFNADGDLEELYALMRDCDELWAHNANFERAITENTLNSFPLIPLEKYRDTAVLAATLALPRSLEEVAMFLRLEDQKDTKGKALMKKFSCPRKPTKLNDTIRVLPMDDGAAFEEYIEYCRQDVATERAVHQRLGKFNLPNWKLWQLDSVMNFRGIPLDVTSIRAALEVVENYSAGMTARFVNITGMNPTQRDRLLAWTIENGVLIDNIQAKTLDDVLRVDEALSDVVREALKIRRSLGRSSTKKLAVMLSTRSKLDNRVRGTLLYHGANTGRWSGRLIQPQNFPRGTLKPYQVEMVIALLPFLDIDLLRTILGDLGDPMELISSSLRGFIKAPKGKEFIVADYSAIEARVLCWLAGQEDVLQLYREDKDAYVDMAAYVFKCNDTDVNEKQRKLGKDIVLGCGYQMGATKFMSLCEGGGNPITEEMAQYAVDSFRTRYNHVKQYWTAIDKMVKKAIVTGIPQQTGSIKAFLDDIFLRIRLPSGRCISYPYPNVEETEKGSRITFLSSLRKGNIFLREGTYGGKLVENITQGVAADIMAIGMVRAEQAGYPVITTIHDEVITEVPVGTGNVEDFERFICNLPSWADGLPLKAKGYRSERYKK